MTPVSPPDTSPRDRAAAIRTSWQDGGQPPDAREALEQDPALRSEKSIVLDLAYEEFWLRQNAGERIDVESFCDRFPTYRASLQRLLAVHQFFDGAPSLLNDVPPPLLSATFKLHDPQATAQQKPPAAPARWPLPGEKLGEFTLLEELGRGSFARVYLARQASAGERLVALKVSRRCDREAGTLGPMRHPNVIEVHLAAHDQRTGFHLVCMAYRGDATLEEVLNRAYPTADSAPPQAADFLPATLRPRPEFVPAGTASLPREFGRGSYIDAIVRLAREIAGALAVVHGRGILHRDLKPSNVLLDHAGVPVLLDFNLAVDASAPAQRIGGTLPYMAPEQVAALIDPRSTRPLPPQTDLFALGVILFQLLTGKHPFHPLPQSGPLEDLASASLVRLRKGALPLRQFNPAAPRRLEQLVARCLAYRPEARPSSAAELAAELERCFTRGRRVRSWLRRRAVPLTAAACLLMAVPVYFAALGGREQSAQERLIEVSDQGRQALAEGRFADAVNRFTEAINLAPSDVRLYLQRSRAHMELNQFAQAEDDLHRANSLKAADPMTMACFGYCAARQSKHLEAIAYFTRALAAGFDASTALNNRGFSYLKLGKLKEADADLQAAREKDPKNGLAFYNRAFVLCQDALSRSAPLSRDAFDDIQRALELQPNEREVSLLAAKIYAWAVRKEAERLDKQRQQQPALAALAGGVAQPATRAGLDRLRELCIMHLHSAQQNGLDPQRWENDLLFGFLKEMPGYRDGIPVPQQVAVELPRGLQDPLLLASR
jgi:serine/threonine protein kinase/Tfp pilus assembly protein PilF